MNGVKTAKVSTGSVAEKIELPNCLLTNATFSRKKKKKYQQAIKFRLQVHHHFSL